MFSSNDTEADLSLNAFGGRKRKVPGSFDVAMTVRSPLFYRTSATSLYGILRFRFACFFTFCYPKNGNGIRTVGLADGFQRA
jgi:hypothetical protein